jgi:glucan phosphorylase
MLTYADVCGRMRTYADVCGRMQVVGAAGVTGGDKLVRMAHLAVIGSKRVNGVAEMHTSILKVVP